MRIDIRIKCKKTIIYYRIKGNIDKTASYNEKDTVTECRMVTGYVEMTFVEKAGKNCGGADNGIYSVCFSGVYSKNRDS